MANYYTKYSFLFPVADKLRPCFDFFIEHKYDVTDAIDASTDESILLEKLKDLSGDDEIARTLVKLVKSYLNDFPFTIEEFSIHNEPAEEEGRFLVWMAGENGMDIVDIVQASLELSGFDDIVIAEYSNDCDRPRIDAYGGGAAVISRLGIQWISGYHEAKKYAKKVDLELKKLDIDLDHLR